MTDEQRLWLWLNYATDHNPKLFYSILQRFESVEEAYAAAIRREFGAFGELYANPACRTYGFNLSLKF